MWELTRARYRHRRAVLLLRAGHDADAEKSAAFAVRLLSRRSTDRADHEQAELFEALVTLARIRTDLTRFDQAEAAYAEALALVDNAASSPTAQRLNAARASVAQADVQRRRADYAQADATLAQVFDRIADLADSNALVAAWHNTARILAKETGRFAHAAKHYAAARNLSGPNDEMRASVLHNVAGLAYMEGRFNEAEQPARTALELRRALQGARSTAVAGDCGILGAVLAELGRTDEAEGHLRNAMAIWSSRFGPSHYEVGATLHTLASLHLKQGKLEQAYMEFPRRCESRFTSLEHTIPRWRSSSGTSAYCMPRQAALRWRDNTTCRRSQHSARSTGRITLSRSAPQHASLTSPEPAPAWVRHGKRLVTAIAGIGIGAELRGHPTEHPRPSARLDGSASPPRAESPYQESRHGGR